MVLSEHLFVIPFYYNILGQVQDILLFFVLEESHIFVHTKVKGRVSDTRARITYRGELEREYFPATTLLSISSLKRGFIPIFHLLSPYLLYLFPFSGLIYVPAPAWLCQITILLIPSGVTESGPWPDKSIFANDQLGAEIV